MQDPLYTRESHFFVLKLGLFRNNFVAGQLILLAGNGMPSALGHAHQLFDDIPSPDVFMYNFHIRAGEAKSDLEHNVAEQGSLWHSLITYTRKLHHPLPPDSFSFAFLLKAAANAKCLVVASQVHCHAL